MMNKLKSCPFCGGEGELDRTWWWEEWEYYVHCTQCNVRTARYHFEEEEAIEAWNKRKKEEGSNE